MTIAAQELFWQLAADLQREDPRVEESTIMNGRCLRVGKEFLALVDYKGSGLVVKLPKDRVAELIEAGVGKPFGPAGKIFKEWVAVPKAGPASLAGAAPGGHRIRRGLAFHHLRIDVHIVIAFNEPRATSA